MRVRITHAKSLRLRPPLCDPMDCGRPGSSVHGTLQARMLEGVAISFSPSRATEAGEGSGAAGGISGEQTCGPHLWREAAGFRAWGFRVTRGHLVTGDGHWFAGSSHCRGAGELGMGGRVVRKVHADTARWSQVWGDALATSVSVSCVCFISTDAL